jgi:hypothetical protein
MGFHPVDVNSLPGLDVAQSVRSNSGELRSRVLLHESVPVDKGKYLPRGKVQSGGLVVVSELYGGLQMCAAIDFSNPISVHLRAIQYIRSCNLLGLPYRILLPRSIPSCALSRRPLHSEHVFQFVHCMRSWKVRDTTRHEQLI